MAKRKSMGKKRRRKGTDPLLWIIPAVIAVILVIVLAVILQKKGDGEVKPADVVPETVSTQETQPESVTQTQADSPTEEAVAAETSDADTKEAADETQQPVEANLAAEVGSMEDEQDPQTSTKTTAGGNSGASVDVGAVVVPEEETAEATLGIDVSKYQGTIDWAQVKAAGVEFAMIRVGYRTKATGILYEDPGARYNLQEATKNGIKTGAYFFSSAVTRQEAEEEAAWVASFISKYKITYPVAYNCEGFQSSDSRQYNLTKEDRTAIAAAFLDAVAASGYTPMFYASRNEMEGSAQWDMSVLGSRYRVWVSQYPEKPFPDTMRSSYSGAHAMWQYTSQGQVAGIRGAVDVNVAYFGYSREAEAKDPSPAQVVEANPEVGISFTEVMETVTAKEQTNLRNIPSTEGSTVVYTLKNGETAQRTGVGSNGWDRVIYNGQKLYAVHNFLTADLTEKPAQAAEPESADAAQVGQPSGTTQAGGLTFRTVREAVTARDRVNLRDQPSTETGQVVGTLSYGEAVVRTGISGSMDTGWSRLEVNGQVVYASSRLLATSMDFKEQEKPTAENPEAGMHFVEASGTVKAKSGETNLRTLPTTNEPSQVAAKLTGEDTAQRIGVDRDKGWTKLSYNGQVVYAVTNYLTEGE